MQSNAVLFNFAQPHSQPNLLACARNCTLSPNHFFNTWQRTHSLLPSLITAVTNSRLDANPLVLLTHDFFHSPNLPILLPLFLCCSFYCLQYRACTVPWLRIFDGCRLPLLFSDCLPTPSIGLDPIPIVSTSSACILCIAFRTRSLSRYFDRLAM